jgi:hypothetical protein
VTLTYFFHSSNGCWNTWNIMKYLSLDVLDPYFKLFRGEFPEANDIWVWWATRATRVAMSTHHL